jgi:hypothetical protein
LTELRPRHLHMVEEYGFRREYDRDALGEYFLVNWYRLFGALRRSKALEVPSDQFRKELMVSRLLDLIECGARNMLPSECITNIHSRRRMYAVRMNPADGLTQPSVG